MKFTYDSEADIAYLKWNDSPISDSESVNEFITVDYTNYSQPLEPRNELAVGIEILNFSKFIGTLIKDLESDQLSKLLIKLVGQ